MQYHCEYYILLLRRLLWGGNCMISEKIKCIREQHGLTQSELARKLGITRSSVNAWEMGVSVPSTQYLVELSGLFKVSTDYLLGITTFSSLSTEGLSEEDIQIVYSVICHLRTMRKKIKHWIHCTVYNRLLINRWWGGFSKQWKSIYLFRLLGPPPIPVSR